MDSVGRIAHLTHPGLLSVDPTAVIDKESPVPLHHQLELFLWQGIESGRFPPHETLPTEQELQEYFGLSRTPIRRRLPSSRPTDWSSAAGPRAPLTRWDGRLPWNRGFTAASIAWSGMAGK